MSEETITPKGDTFADFLESSQDKDEATAEELEQDESEADSEESPDSDEEEHQDDDEELDPEEDDDDDDEDADDTDDEDEDEDEESEPGLPLDKPIKELNGWTPKDAAPFLAAVDLLGNPETDKRVVEGIMLKLIENTEKVHGNLITKRFKGESSDPESPFDDGYSSDGIPSEQVDPKVAALERQVAELKSQSQKREGAERAREQANRVAGSVIRKIKEETGYDIKKADVLKAIELRPEEDPVDAAYIYKRKEINKVTARKKRRRQVERAPGKIKSSTKSEKVAKKPRRGGHDFVDFLDSVQQ